eukprot:TRINITY_DN30905_c0_g1_i1.p1 TRINITY_DN30905_c0_g1~~TRINITY_DN30905_c0_g1_i1.p1  ORF type:complete len:141 (+),score=21.08 TRINITY_DN30905_c0_g1_i1:405-827(+)
MLNVYWAEYYREAMEKAVVMVFLISEGWLRSDSCWEEVYWATTPKFETARHGKRNLVVLLDEYAKRAWRYEEPMTNSSGHIHTLKALKALKPTVEDYSAKKTQCVGDVDCIRLPEVDGIAEASLQACGSKCNFPDRIMSS